MSDVELGEPAFWILTSLAGGRRHGYAIIQEAAAASDGRVALKVTTLYAALERLERLGWISANGEEVVDGRTRRYYRISETGSARLGEEATRLAERARVATERLASARLGTALVVA